MNSKPPADPESILARCPLRALDVGDPDERPDRVWLYPRAQFARGALRALVEGSRRAARHVSYPDNALPPSRRAEFILDGPCARLVSATGSVSVGDAGSAPVPLLLDGPIELRAGSRVRVDAAPGIPPAIAIDIRTAEQPTVRTRILEDDAWYDADARIGGRVPPHLAGEPATRVELQRSGDLHVAPHPVLGELLISAADAPRETGVITGETPEEARAPFDLGESQSPFVPLSPGVWISSNRLGFRYARVVDDAPNAVHVNAHVRRFDRRGAFTCSDHRLSRMWTAAATTLGLCMQSLVVDGLKRDRVPWMGDNAAAIWPNMYAFGDSTAVRDGVAALMRSTRGYANGIADYTLWGVISLGLGREAFADPAILDENMEDLVVVMRSLLSQCDDRGLLRTTADDSAFAHCGPDAVFLDWGAVPDPDRTSTAFQALWFWALTTARRLFSLPDWHDREDVARLEAQCANVEAALHRSLHATGRDPNRAAWREYLDGESEVAPLPNTLAVLSGLSSADEASVLDVIETTSTGTPAMRAWALRALLAGGRRASALNMLERHWGPMLDTGTPTFWEELSEATETPTAMYGRPFGKSMCHGWSSGPADILPRLLLGVEPLNVGWTEFSVTPELGDLEWAACVVPTTFGPISVVADADGASVDIPAGTALIDRGTRMSGPLSTRIERTH